MTSDELRTAQAPLKTRYREEPAAALIRMHAAGTLDPKSLLCHVDTPAGRVGAGLHPAAGGDGSAACSGDMLLQALVACAGVTVCAVATALNLLLRSGTVQAEGELDFRGTLGVSKEVAVGFLAIRLSFVLDIEATDEQLQSLGRLTERYCVVAQSLRPTPNIAVSRISVN